MAKVILKEKREIEAGYHIYRQPSPAGDLITVRRKVATLSDVQHKSSKATQRHRQIFSRASKRWAAIPAPVKADMANNYAWVPVQGHFAEADYKVLKGQQLFISQEIHQQQYHQTHQPILFFLCFVLTDELDKPIDLETKLTVYTQAGSVRPPGRYLCLGNTLFYPVPEEALSYWVGYAYSGMIGLQLSPYYWPHILLLRYKRVMPYINVYGPGPYCLPSYPPGKGFEPLKSWGPPYLWQYNIHQATGQAWREYLPWTAYHLSWKKIEPDIFTVTITVHNPVRAERVYLGLTHDLRIMWDIIEDAPGTYHLEPPQHTCRYHVCPWYILGYED